MNEIKELKPINTVAEVAEFLGCSRKTIMRYLASGSLPASKVERRWFIAKSDVADLLKNTKNCDV